MKVDEPYDPSRKSIEAPEGLEFRIAVLEHTQELVEIMRERNPEISYETMEKKIRGEITLNENDPFYWLYVVILDGRVVALCRFFHSMGMPSDKKKYPSPEGWYGMGTLVAKGYRRRGIARFVFGERIRILKELEADRLFSIVDPRNLASMRMHQQFGFCEIARDKGFLHLGFEGHEAVLFEVRIF